MTLRWVPGWNGLTEPEAVSYVAAVEAADGEPLEYGVARAINDFVVGCKNDGIWSAIKASCILAGARTLNGALVPLVGTAPTNNNFVSGDYNRSTGLVGDGSTKYLDSNRNNNADPQDNRHLAAYNTIAGSGTRSYIATSSPSGGSWLARDNSAFYARMSANVSANTATVNSVIGFIGGSRSNNAVSVARINGTSVSSSISSLTPANQSFRIFARPDNTQYANDGLGFYSIGEALDLEKLDTRVTRLMNLITYTQTAGLPDLSTMDLDAAAYIGGAYRAGGTLS